MRSNSVGTAAAGRILAMHKLTGGTESYDPSPSPTPPPLISKLGRNNTVSGGERIAARQNMLNRLGTRVTREADAEAASGAEEKNIKHPKRRNKRRSKGSYIAATTPVSDSDFPLRMATLQPFHHHHFQSYRISMSSSECSQRRPVGR
jgi:serine/arginine repetitive matrix protein 2